MSDGRHVGTPEWLTLARDERVLLHTGPSQNLLLAGIAAGMVLLVVISTVVAALGNIALGRLLSFIVVVLVVAILAGIYAFVHRWEYALTSDRVCVATGLVSRERREIPLADVVEVSVDQSAWHRAVSVGDLVFTTTEGPLRFTLVGRPHRVQEQVLTSMDAG